MNCGDYDDDNDKDYCNADYLIEDEYDDDDIVDC